MSEVGTMAAYLEYTQVGTAIYGRLSVARNGSVKERVMYVHVQPNMYNYTARAGAGAAHFNHVIPLLGDT